jgi:hypothetical protein
MFADKVDGFDSVLALGYNVDVAYILQQEGKFVASELLIVHDDSR